MISPAAYNDRIVSNLDFAETFLEAAGLPFPRRCRGKSRALARGENASGLAHELLLSTA